MEINWPVLIIVLLVLAALVFFLMRRNVKDEQKFEEEIQQKDLTEHKLNDSEETNDPV